MYHGALRFITDCKHLTHDCTVYSRVAWSSLAVRRKMHWYLMICKAICFFFTTVSLLFDSTKISMYLSMYYNLNVPSARTHLGTKAFKYAALSDWNFLQMKLRLNQLVPTRYFKTLLSGLEKDLEMCKCF